MALSLQSFSTMVGNMAAGVQGACTTLIDLTVGSVLRAILEGSAAIGLWMQALILQVLALTRLASSTGTDVDSWIADFGLARLPGVASTVPVLMASLSPASQSATVPPGALVKTADGSLVFAVTLDTTNAAWSGSSGAYIRPAGVASITVPTQCQTPGTIGNVTVGAINILGTQIAGIDTVTNLAAATNGANPETDAAVRSRVVTFFLSLASATVAAIQNAIATVQTGLFYSIADGYNASGAAQPGTFTVYVDDGTGSPSNALVASVAAAVNNVRACGITAAVLKPAVVTANAVIPVHLAAGANAAAVQAAIANAITADIDGVAVGAGYSYSRLSYLAISAGGASVSSVGVPALNGLTSDITAQANTVVRAGAIAVTTS